MAKEKSQPLLLNEFIMALTNAIGSAGQLIHLHRDMRFAVIRDTLELVKDKSTEIATSSFTYTPKD